MCVRAVFSSLPVELGIYNRHHRHRCLVHCSVQKSASPLRICVGHGDERLETEEIPSTK